jgi:6-phosphogluconolactonase
MAAAPEIRIFNEAEDLACEAADLFVWLGGQAIASSGRFRVALSGGSTPKTMQGLLAGEAFDGQVDWRRVEFYFGDERCVPPDHPESNYGMAEATLFRPLRIPPEQVFRMAGEAFDPAQAARDYEGLIRTRFGTPAPDWPRFDLVILGLGEDGHTASLFPGTRALDERERLVVDNRSPRGVPSRLTCTAPLINQAQAVLFLVSGASKAAAARAVLEDRDRDPARFPAKLIRPVQGRLIWFLDRAAASELTLAKQQVVSHEE